jgi:hypothetical protein
VWSGAGGYKLCSTGHENLTQNIACREQERLEKAEQARRETERILREQRAAIDAKEVRARARGHKGHICASMCHSRVAHSM